MRIIIEPMRRSLNRAFARIALLLAAVAVAVIALPSAAMADEYYYRACAYTWYNCQTGVTGYIAEGDCGTANSYHHKTYVCVDYDGDYVYVYDGQADGYAAMAYVSTRAGEIQGRYCRNNHGYGTMARCNFDWVEDTDHFVQAGYKIDYATEAPLQTLWEWSGK
ncbi:hypothetical protein [Glycomyces dulcitolivorans]|uniref:hypothetical protein n=1 Tax=Glycomyces dulcitolivorans TaxID=2200759 RepID=UPI000DD46AEF|nr:hypothetical protein [Glycomyces dulcitolivorans]